MKKRWHNVVLAGILACVVGMPVKAATIDIYEKLNTPNYEALELEIKDVEEPDYTMDVYDGRIYIAGDSLTVERNRKESPVVLIYDESEKTWSTIWATFLETDSELQIVAGDGKLYFFDNHYSRLDIYAYDLESKEVKEMASFNREESERGCNLLYDNGAVWMIDGEYLDSATEEWRPLETVSRWDIESGKLEGLDLSNEEYLKAVEGKVCTESDKEQIVETAQGVLVEEQIISAEVASDEEEIYVFGDVEKSGVRENLFLKLIIQEYEVQEPTNEEDSQAADRDVESSEGQESEATHEDAEQSDSEAEMTKIIVAVCAVVLIGGTILQIIHKKKNKKTDEGEDE